MKSLLALLGRVGRFIGRISYATANAIYKLITRTALYLVTAYLATHFLVNSNLFRNDLMDVLGEALPGRFDCETLHWGPSPWDVTLIKVDIQDPAGTPVIRADRISVEVDLLAMWQWTLKKAVIQNTPFHLRFSETRIDGADVLTEITKNDFLGISAAFSDPTEASDSDGPGAWVEVDGIQLTNSRVRVDVPGVRVDSRDLNILGRVEIKDGRINAQCPTIQSHAGDVFVDGAGPNGSTLHLPWTDFTAISPAWKHGLLLMRQSSLRIADADARIGGRLDTRGEQATVDAKAELSIAPENSLIKGYAGDRLQLSGELIAEASGPFRWPDLAATLRADDLQANGIQMGPLDLKLRMHRAPWRRLLTIEPLSLSLANGVIHIDRASLIVGESRDVEQQFEVSVRLEELEPTLLWNLGFIPTESLVPEMLNGVLDGWFDARADRLMTATGTTTWEVDSAVDLTATWDGNSTVPLDTAYGATGNIHLLATGDQQDIESTGLHLWAGPQELSIEGQLAFPSTELNLGVESSMDLVPILESLDVLNVKGVVGLNNVLVTNTLLSPELTGHLTLHHTVIEDLPLSNVSADLSIRDGKARLRALKAQTEWGRLRTDASLELWDQSIQTLSDDWPLTLENLQVTGIDLAKLPNSKLAGIAAVQSRRFSLKLGKQDLEPEGQANIEVRGFNALGESFHHFAAGVQADPRRIRVTSLDARTIAGGRFQGKGGYTYASGDLDVDLVAQGLDLSRLGLLQSQDSTLRGIVDLEVTAKGPLADMQLEGRVQTRGFGLGEINLGAATIQFSRERGSRGIALSSRDFFPAMRLKRGEIQLDRTGLPERLLASAELKDWSALNIMPSLSETLQRAEIVEGDVLFDMSFNQSTPLRIGLEVPRSRFLHVQAQDSTIVATNLGPLSVQLRGDELSIERMVVKAAQQKLALCGLYDLTNQTVRMDIAGALRLDKLTGLKVILPDLEGRLITAPRENQRVAQFDDSCLQRVINPRTRRALGNPKGYLRLTDSIYNPAIRGALRFNDVRATPRGLGEIALQSGVLHLERAADGQQRLFVPMEAPLNGSFDEGTFRLHGEAALPQVAKRTRIEDWLPNKGWVDLKGEELYWSEPNEYNITVDPTVRLTFDHLSDEVEKAKLDLSGRIDLPEGEYFKNLSFFARTVGNILSRSVDAYSVSITEQYPALNDLGLALEVEGNNFTVRSDAGFVYTDLETAMKLRVEGTLGDPLVTGYIEVTDGTVTYRPVRREFEVNRGRISFSGDPTRPELDFEGETVIEGAGTQLSNRDTEDIVITLRLSGTPPDDLHPEFESKPSLPQTDIQFLILAGRTRADLETGGFQTTSTLDLFSANLADFVTNLIKAPFVESLDVVPLTDGSVGVGGQFRFGRFIRLGVTGRQQDGATTYDARYVHRIRDDLILEAIRRGPSENSQDRERYEVRLKYTVTLD